MSIGNPRRAKILALCRSKGLLVQLELVQLEQLYDIVVHEYENWDGESVEPQQIVDIMNSRFGNYGLSPSRN